MSTPRSPVSFIFILSSLLFYLNKNKGIGFYRSPTALRAVGVILDVSADWNEWKAMVKAPVQDVDVWACMNFDSMDENEPATIEIKINSTLSTPMEIQGPT